MNFSLFQLINDMAGQSNWLDNVMIFAARTSIWLFAIPLLYFWFRGQKLTAVYAVATTLMSLAIGQIITMFYHHPRPFMEHAVTKLIAHAADPSFPSDHALVAFSLSFAMLMRSRKWGYPFMALAVWIGFARVYAGVHYPVDIIGGAAIALVSALTIRRSERWLEPWIVKGMNGFAKLRSRFTMGLRS